MNYNYVLNLKDDMLVLYADIIGFSNIILENHNITDESTGFNIIIESIYNSIFYKYSKEYQIKYDIKFLWVSDSIFMTTSITNINQLIKELDYITHQLYCAHLSIRGAISIGKLYFENNIWGTAVVNAVNNEKQAKYPCIVITKSDYLRLNIDEETKDYFIPLKVNDFIYYDFFKSYIGQVIKNNMKTNILNVYTDFIENSFVNSKKVEHKEKWAFLAKHLTSAMLYYSNNIMENNENALKQCDGSHKHFLSVEQYFEKLKNVLTYINGANQDI